MSTSFGPIVGLRWEERQRLDNGGNDSFVVPVPTTRPINLVYHGESRFDYGHYGIHLGQEDRLTFLGKSSQVIRAFFVDCREGSPTLHQRFVAEFSPHSGRVLCIPPGIAHAFDGLENVYTINEYRLFLPDPDLWLSGKSQWNFESDVINLPMDVKDEDLPSFVANSCDASDEMYRLVANQQKRAVPNIQHHYPFTEDVQLDDGTAYRLMFRKKGGAEKVPEWEPIEGIEGAGWHAHLSLPSGDHSGFIPMVDERPFYVVDHGEVDYTHDAFGIHLGQVDHLTFVGPMSQEVKLVMVDCREDSPTLHKRVELTFTPSPLRYLVIPNGVAHRFEHLGNVFTINRAAILAENEDEYKPANDVIDWPIERKDYPRFRVSTKPVSDAFYRKQVAAQRQFLDQPPMHATPMVLVTKDAQGREVRVALRKQANAPA